VLSRTWLQPNGHWPETTDGKSARGLRKNGGLIICRAHPDHFPKAVHNLLPSPLMTCQTSLRRWIWPMEKMPHGEHRTPVQSRQLLRHTIRAENQSAVAQSWHDPVAEKWGQRVRQVLRRERIRKVKRSQEFIHSLLVGTRVRGRHLDNGGSGICRIEFSPQPSTLRLLCD